MKDLLVTPHSRWIRYISTLALKLVLIATFFLLLTPAVSLAEGPLKPTGTAENNVTLWLPEGSVNPPVLATADYIAPADLPDGLAYPPNAVGLAFTFGLWQDDGVTIDQFNPSIVLNVGYEDSDIPSALLPEESRLHLYMYDPATQSWLKLCSSVDIHENVLSAAISGVTPYEENGSTLVALAIDNTPPLNQVVDGQGDTDISVKGSDLRLQVLEDAVQTGAHFAITVLPGLSKSSQVKLLTKPVDIKSCWVDYTKPSQNNRQITEFLKPIKVGFEYDADTSSRAGGKTNLTLVNLRNDQWVNVESVGARVVRGDDALTVDTSNLGTFGLAVR